ncbi:MAG: hypothetical protein N3F09_10045 [Bacteroidia bacterium]|nr:hypothetical protein [Bacteroidia bacterium]
MKNRILFLFLIPSFIISQYNPQGISNIEKVLLEADEALFNKGLLSYNNRDFISAAKIFDSLQKKYTKSIELKYLFSCAGSYLPEYKTHAYRNLKELREFSPLLENYSFFMGQAYEMNDSIESALYWFRKYDKEYNIPNPINPDLKKKTPEKIKNLEKALELKMKANPVQIKNIGRPVNSEAWEYTPLVPQDESFIIFTYRGPKSKGGKQKITKGVEKVKEEEKLYFEDVFISFRINDTGWTEPQPINSINTQMHDAAVALSHDGREMFIYKNLGKGYGDLFISTFDGKNWSVPVYQKGLNSDKWDGSAAFMPNKDEIIFASERPGGRGKKDLWKAKRIGPNTWGNIENLGPDINTEDDEDAPFITADGKILFFSTNSKISTGGYDIVRSDLGDDGKWKKPYNLGKPINSPIDDKFFMVIGNGSRAYYSSYKEDTKGGYDIYSIEPGIPGTPVSLVQIITFSYLDNQPVESEVVIKSSDEKKLPVQKLKTTRFDGKAIVNLPSGMDYTFEFSIPNFTPQIKTLSVPAQDTFIKMFVYNDFYSEDYLKRIKRLEDSIRKESSLKSSEKELINFFDKYADYQNDSIRFKVQVGAFRFVENFDLNKLISFGKIQRVTGKDKITRFYAGNFKTIREIRTFSDEIKKVIPDAFVVIQAPKNFYYLSDFRKILESK